MALGGDIGLGEKIGALFGKKKVEPAAQDPKVAERLNEYASRKSPLPGEKVADAAPAKTPAEIEAEKFALEEQKAAARKEYDEVTAMDRLKNSAMPIEKQAEIAGLRLDADVLARAAELRMRAREIYAKGGVVPDMTEKEDLLTRQAKWIRERAEADIRAHREKAEADLRAHGVDPVADKKLIDEAGLSSTVESIAVGGGAEGAEKKPTVTRDIMRVNFDLGPNRAPVEAIHWNSANRNLWNVEFPEEPRPGSIILIQEKNAQGGRMVFRVNTPPAVGLTDEVKGTTVFVSRITPQEYADDLEKWRAKKMRMPEAQPLPQYEIKIPVVANGVNERVKAEALVA